MPAKRCSLHAINYPVNYNMCLVDGCQERNLSYFTNMSPDDDWREQVDDFNRLLGDNEADVGWDHNLISVGPRVLHETIIHLGDAAVPDCITTIHQYADKLWVTHEDLIKATYTHLEDFQIVMVNGEFYELQAHVGRAYPTHGLRGGAWWIEKINIYQECEDIRALPTCEEVNNYGEEDQSA